MSTYSISVRYTCEDPTPFWSKYVEKDEYSSVKKLSEKSEKIVSMQDQLLRPTRTYNIITFVKDLVLPWSISVVPLIKNIAQKILFLPIALVVDLATLPVRLFTCIPRILINQAPFKHPLHQYLTQQKAPLFSTTERVWIAFHERYVNSTIKDQKNNCTQDAAHFDCYVNFIEAPWYPHAYNMSRGGASGLVWGVTKL